MHTRWCEYTSIRHNGIGSNENLTDTRHHDKESRIGDERCGDTSLDQFNCHLLTVTTGSRICNEDLKLDAVLMSVAKEAKNSARIAVNKDTLVRMYLHTSELTDLVKSNADLILQVRAICVDDSTQLLTHVLIETLDHVRLCV